MPIVNGPAKSKPLASVQIARGLAATVVVFAHANLLIGRTLFHGWFVQGWCGVDFFFVLSGFIIFYANGKDIGRPERLSLYAYKRFVRVYPIYWVYTAGLLLATAALFPVLHKSLITWRPITPSTVFQCLILYPSDVAHNVMPFLPPGWTLSYEVMFYAVFAVLIAVPKKAAFILPATWILASVACLFWGVQIASPLWTVLVSPRNLEFLFGAAVAYQVVRNPRRWARLYTLGLIVGLTALLAAWVNAHTEYRYSAPYNTFSFGIPFAVIVYCIAGPELVNDGAVKPWQKPLLYAGDASYSIYLVHFPLITLFRVTLTKAGFTNAYGLFCLIVPTSIGIGLLCFRFIEQPMMRRLQRRRNEGVAVRVAVG